MRPARTPHGRARAGGRPEGPSDHRLRNRHDKSTNICVRRCNAKHDRLRARGLGKPQREEPRPGCRSASARPAGSRSPVSSLPGIAAAAPSGFQRQAPASDGRLAGTLADINPGQHFGHDPYAINDPVDVMQPVAQDGDDAMVAGSASSTSSAGRRQPAGPETDAGRASDRRRMTRRWQGRRRRCASTSAAGAPLRRALPAQHPVGADEPAVRSRRAREDQPVDRCPTPRLSRPLPESTRSWRAARCARRERIRAPG